jgi:hypothetical protein
VYTGTVVMTGLAPVSGSYSRIWPPRVLCSTRPSGSTASDIGSPGSSFSVTFS